MQHVDALSRAPVALLLSTDLILEAQQQSNDVYTSKAISTTPDGLKQIRIHGKCRTVVPNNFRLCLLNESHDNSGHPGIRKTQQQIAVNYWWPQMRNDIKRYVQSCHACQMVKPAQHPTFGQLQPLPTPEQPMELISMDTVVMGSSARGTKAKYIQVVLDHNSRYVWAKATPTNTAQASISLLQEVFNASGPAKRLLTDNGTNYRSNAMKRFLREHHCSQVFTSTYHPQTNGANEKVNGTIVKGIKLALHDKPRLKWSSVLKTVVDNYNNTLHDTTGFTPSFLMFGRDALNTSTPALTEARNLAQQRSDAFKLKKKEAYDRTHSPLTLNIGDLVKRRIPDNRPDVKSSRRNTRDLTK
jgi:transposase InsO family protein